MTNHEVADLWSKAIVQAKLEGLPEPIVFARMVIDRYESAAVGALREIDGLVGSCADASERARDQSAVVDLLARVAEAAKRGILVSARP